jgi:class 3 adenylate cyclase/tetratricopeptide (TPR) repeat protein
MKGSHAGSRSVASLPRLIHTLHGRGYRFVAAIEERSHEPPDGERPRSLFSPQALEQKSGPDTPEPTARSEAEARASPAHDAERKPVTVLCCGLAEPVAPTVALDPEARHHQLQAFVVAAQTVLLRYGGTITQLIEDGLLALFGAPLAQEDHARRAVLAALDLRQTWQNSQRAANRPLDACIGVHTGLVVVGDLGQEAQRFYTAVGGAIPLAVRLRQRAAPDTILISAAAQCLVQDEVQAETCGTLDVAAQAAPIPVYTVHQLVRRRSGVPGRDGRAWSRFIGRARELALLHERLAHAGGGRGQVVGIAGEPGIGKSRLLYEFAQSLRRQSVIYREGHCLAYASTTPYSLLRNLLRQLCGLGEADAAESIAPRMDQYLRQIGMVPEDEAPILLRLLNVPVDAMALAQLRPEAHKARTFALLHQVILGESRRQPLILAVENLHWIDATSDEWLTMLAERLPGTAILLLATYRPGCRPPWLDKSYATQLALPHLTPRESLMVVQAVAQTTPIPDHLTQGIISKAAGNPFFLEELTRSVQEEGRHYTALTIPDTIQAVLIARIDQLPPAGKRLLQTAAVIGKDVPLPLLQAIADLPEEALCRGLMHLQASEFVYETKPFPEPEYTFMHALTQEVAYESLLQERQRALHARIVLALETHYPDRIAEHVERLADHAFRGEMWDKAVVYFQHSGAKAASHSAYREAVTCFERALVALRYFPGNGDMYKQAIDLRFDLHNVLFPLGEHERILQYLREAEGLAQAHGDQRRLGRVFSYMTRRFLHMADYDQTIASGERALAIAVTLGDFGLQIATNFFLGQAYYFLGDYHHSVDCLGRNVASLKGELLAERFGLHGLASVFSRTWLVASLVELGLFSEGIAYGEEEVRIAESVDDPYNLVHASYSMGLLSLRKGDFHRAISVLERGLGLCRAKNISQWFPPVASALGYAYALSGRVAGAVSLLEEALEQAATIRQLFHHALWMVYLGEAYLLAGRRDDAVQLAGRALDLCCERKERGHQTWALRLLSEIHAQQEPPEVERAEDTYQQAMTLAEELGMRPLQAHCHLGLGMLFARLGRREQARTELSGAIELYRAMDMTFWPDRAEAALAALPQADTAHKMPL